ncbi:putative nucleotidyltransferase [compost metagenome]
MQLTEFQRDEIRACVAGKPDPILFATACGPLLYGFPHQSRYIDLRGVHLDPRKHLARGGMQETREWRECRGEVQIEWVSHEVGKFVRLLQLNNGGAYEQLFSPNVVASSPAFDSLKGLAEQMLSQQLFLHYRSFFHGQLKFFLAQRDKHGRHLLYLYRVALTGVHLMEHGQLCANLPALARFHERAAVLQLLHEMGAQGELAVTRAHLRELGFLAEMVEGVQNRAKLPEQVPHRDAAEAWLADLRAASAEIGA